MSRLRIFAEARPADAAADHRATTPTSARELAQIGVRFEQWQAAQPVAPGDAPDVDPGRLSRRHRPPRRREAASRPWTWSASRRTTRSARRCARSSSTSTSTRRTRCASSSPARACSRCTSASKVYEILCEQGDLIGVPDSTRHWFDMGPEPRFVAIRFFTEPDGWVGHFTGTDIAQRFPRY